MLWPNFDQSENFTTKQLQRLETHYQSTWIGDFALLNKNGLYTEEPYSVFYNPKPNLDRGHKHLFGLRSNGRDVFITDASQLENKELTGIEVEDGEILFSCYRHHFHSTITKSGEVFIDGGFDYVRRSGGIITPYLFNGKHLAELRNSTRKEYHCTETQFMPDNVRAAKAA